MLDYIRIHTADETQSSHLLQLPMGRPQLEVYPALRRVSSLKIIQNRAMTLASDQLKPSLYVKTEYTVPEYERECSIIVVLACR